MIDSHMCAGVCTFFYYIIEKNLHRLDHFQKYTLGFLIILLHNLAKNLSEIVFNGLEVRRRNYVNRLRHYFHSTIADGS